MIRVELIKIGKFGLWRNVAGSGVEGHKLLVLHGIAVFCCCSGRLNRSFVGIRYQIEGFKTRSEGIC